MIAALANHLWQSTAFALAAAVLVAALRRNRASVRHGIWMIASVKWVVPFSWLLALGSHITFINSGADAVAAGVRMPASVAVAARHASEPFALEGPLASLPSLASGRWLLAGCAAIWICGFLAVAMTRLRDWLRIRRAIRQSVTLDVVFPAPRVPVCAAPGLLEPGVVGIWRPILLVPMGIEHHLTPAEWQSVLAHESAHVTRRDNLTAALHMVIETVLWFHPLVWWIGARLVEERERACDEEVLALGIPPRDYAEGILKVCRLYVESPLACVAGVSGSHLSNLTGRIEDIMMSRIGQRLSVTRRLMLGAVAASMVIAPLAVGGVTTVQAQSALPASSAGSRQSSTIGDLASVVKLIEDPAATLADRERLIGKTFSGLVAIQAVRLPLNDKTLAIVEATLAGAAADDSKTLRVGLRFNARADEPSVQLLRKTTPVRVRGTLTRFSTGRNIVWADFSDFAIEGSGPGR